MPNHASITLVGHIGEPKISGDGDTACARFGLAVTRKRKAGDVTTWFNVTCWRKDAAFVAQYVKKGALLLVEGEPYQEEYEGKTYLKVDARRVLNLSPKQDAEAAPAPAAKPAPRKPAPAPAAADDEPPFARPLIAEVWG